MAKKDYMPTDDAGKAALYLHVRSNVSTHFSVLGITSLTAQIVAQSNDALAFDFIYRAQQTLIPAGQEATSAKNRLRDGDSVAPNLPVALTFPASPGLPPTAVNPGVVLRFRLFVKWIRSLPGYTEAIGEALRIIGDEAADSDLSTVKPNFKLFLNGGRVEVGWGWDGLRGQVDAQEIHVDRGDGTGFHFLTIDTRPGYIDTEPFRTTRPTGGAAGAASSVKATGC